MSIVLEFLVYILIEFFIYLFAWGVLIFLWFIIMPLVIILAFPFILLISFRGNSYRQEFKRLYMKVIDLWLNSGFDLLGNKYRKIKK